MNFSIEKCNVFRDSRGILLEFLDAPFLQQKALDFGQVYVLTFEGKGLVRGNHYHAHSSELFCLVNGDVEIILEDVNSKERFSGLFSASNNELVRIFIGSGIAHAIKSISDFALVLSYSSKAYSQAPEDKFIYPLIS